MLQSEPALNCLHDRAELLDHAYEVEEYQIEESDDVSFGFNAATQKYENLVASGIIVPTKVERVALQNAASIAGLLLTTDCAITEVKEKKAKAAAGHDHGEDY